MRPAAAPLGTDVPGWPRAATPAEEQAWNERQLAGPVRSRRVAIWTYRVPAVVLGCSQRPDDALAATARAAGLGLVQRRSGGGALLADAGLLGVSVVLPPDDPLVTPVPATNYRWLGLALAGALGRLGIDARALDVAAARARPDAPAGAGLAADADLRWACFGALSPWEVVAAGDRKLAGLAQVHRRHGTLLVAGILVRDADWAALGRVFGRPPEEAARLAERTTSCERELRRLVTPEEVSGEVARALQAALGTGVLEAPDAPGPDACEPGTGPSIA